MRMEVFSKHSSALKIKSQNFRIFKIIERIKNHVPKVFYWFFVCIAVEILLAILFAIIYQLFETDYIENQYKTLSDLSFDELVSDLHLNDDRADVIVPALRIYLSAMKWSNAQWVYVPKIGLSDGIVKAMYFGKI